MPAPGSLDNCFQIGITRTPAQQGRRLLRVRDKLGRIAWTPRLLLNRETHARNSLHAPDDFLYRDTAARSQIYRFAASATSQMLERRHMRTRLIAHMDVVPDGCAVTSGVVGSKYVQAFAPAKRGKNG